MIRQTAWILVFGLAMATMVSAQEQRVNITSFEEEDFTWQWTGGNIPDSGVEENPGGVAAADGNYVLVVVYDNRGSTWQYTNMSFPIGSVDLTGMREIRMSVFFTEQCQGNLSMRLDLASGNILGMAYAPSKGQWHELVFPIDRKLSESDFIKSINWFGGFFAPETGTNSGEVYIDNIYGIRPAGTPEVEEVLIYGFNEADPGTGEPAGWTVGAEGHIPPELGTGDVTPKEGNNYMVMWTGPGYVWSVQTTNALAAFNRWPDVKEVLFDVYVGDPIASGWLQSRIDITSNITGSGVDDAYTSTREIGYADATSNWKELLYEVDMTPHLANIADPNGWLRIRISTNNDANNDLDKRVFVDNFRVAVAKSTDVTDWMCY